MNKKKENIVKLIHKEGEQIQKQKKKEKKETAVNSSE